MYLKKKRIFFRVDADHGELHGLGHLNRVMKLYHDLKLIYRSKYNFCFITKKNSLSHSIIKKKTKEKIYFIENLIKKNFFFKEDKIIVDTLGIEKKLISILINSNIKEIISLDEINKNFYKKGIIINGIYFTKKKLKPKKDIRIYQNIKYITLDKQFSIKKKLNINNKILITSGGGDQKNFLYKIAKIFLNNFGKKFYLYIVIGRGVKKNNKIFRLRAHKNINFVMHTNRIKKFFDKSTFCVTSGGNVMFEAISSGRTTFVAETYQNQSYAIKHFKRKKLIYYIGKANSIKKNVILKNLNKLKGNIVKLKKNYKKNTSAIDGKGYLRVLKIMKNYLDN